jgi:hypothetical protein
MHSNHPARGNTMFYMGLIEIVADALLFSDCSDSSSGVGMQVGVEY